MKRYISAGMSLFLVALMVSCKEAPKPAKVNSAKIVFSVGDVSAGIGGNWKPVTENMPLTEGYEIKTGESSQCNIVIGTDSFVSIKEGSLVSLSQLFKDTSGVENTSVELKVGKAVVNPKKLLKGDEFRVKTPTAIAAVRGTQFVVDTKPEGNMQIAVVSGKVELKRRIPALDELNNTVISKSEALSTLQKKVDEEAVVIQPNQTSTIDNKKMAEENKTINKVVEKHVEVIKQKEADVKPEKGTAKVDQAPDKKVIENRIREEELKKELAALDIMKEKKEAEQKQAITVENKIDKKAVQEVKELEKVIETVKKEEEKKKAEKTPEAVTELTVVSPVKGSSITVNGKIVGYDTVTITPAPNADLSVNVTAPGHETYAVTVRLSPGEKKSIQAEMIPGATLSIQTPVAASAIYVNGRFAGRGEAVVSPPSGTTVAIEIQAPGYRKYENNVIIHRGKAQVLKVALEKDKELERLMWTEKVGLAVKTRPLYINDLVVATTADGYVVAMSRGGQQVWKRKIGRAIESSPVAFAGSVLVSTTTGEFFAMALTSGEIVWKKNLYGSLLFGASPVVSGGHVLIATSYGRVYRLDTKGVILWQVDLENGIYSSPTVSGGMMYIGAEDHRVYALSEHSGKIAWEVKLDSRMVASDPVIDGMNLYLGSYKGTVYSINRLTGKIVWQTATGDAIVSTAVVRGGSVYIGSNDGFLYSFNTGDGKIRWKYNAGNRIITSPLYHEGMIFLASGNQLVSLRANDGALQWKQAFNQIILSSPSVSNNEVYVGLASGDLVSVRISLKDMVQ